MLACELLVIDLCRTEDFGSALDVGHAREIRRGSAERGVRGSQLVDHLGRDVGPGQIPGGNQLLHYEVHSEGQATQLASVRSVIRAQPSGRAIQRERWARDTLDQLPVIARLCGRMR